MSGVIRTGGESLDALLSAVPAILERELVRFEWEQRIAERTADLRAGREQTVPLVDLEREIGIHGTVPDADALDHLE